MITEEQVTESVRDIKLAAIRRAAELLMTYARMAGVRANISLHLDYEYGTARPRAPELFSGLPRRSLRPSPEDPTALDIITVLDAPAGECDVVLYCAPESASMDDEAPPLPMSAPVGSLGE